QVNQIGHYLEAQGLIRRSREADGLIHNWPTPGTQPQHPNPINTSPAGRVRSAAKPSREQATIGPGVVLQPSKALIVIPCSSRKRRGGTAQLESPGILTRLPEHLQARLRAARL